MCCCEIELCAQNLDTFLILIGNTVGSWAYVITVRD